MYNTNSAVCNDAKKCKAKAKGDRDEVGFRLEAYLKPLPPRHLSNEGIGGMSSQALEISCVQQSATQRIPSHRLYKSVHDSYIKLYNVFETTSETNCQNIFVSKNVAIKIKAC